MARCTVCKHASKKEIDKELILSVDSIAKISRKYALEVKAVWRHKKNHIKDPEDEKVPTPKEVEGYKRLTIDQRLKMIENQMTRCLAKQDEAIKISDWLHCMAMYLTAIEKYSKIMGDMVETFTFKNDPHWEKAQEIINQAADYDPEFGKRLIQELAAVA